MMSCKRRSARLDSAWPTRLACAALLLCAQGLAQGKDSVDGEIIVRLRDDGEIAPLLVKHRLSLTGRFGARPIYRLKVIGAADLKAKIDALRGEFVVRSAEPNATYEGLEPDKNVAWAIGEPQPFAAQWAAQAIHLAEAHRISTGAGMRVAVLDTGVDRQHPALAGKLLPGFDFVDFDTDPSEGGGPAHRSWGHGTHVAGLVALVAPDARIMPLRILDADGAGNLWVLGEAMLHAVDPDGNPATDDGAHVINLSLSSLAKTDLFKTVATLVSCRKHGLGGKKDSDEDDKDDADDAEDAGAGHGASAADKQRCSGFGGAVVVAAAGNRGSDKLREYPAAESSPALLSVAASSAGGWLADFSNSGAWIKLAAPGDRTTSSVPGGGYASWSGTSMAAPIVAGAAALLRAADLSLSANQLVARLTSRGSRLCGTPLKQLDVAAALSGEAARDKPDCGPRRR
jgi:subtilisin family serine protease